MQIRTFVVREYDTSVDEQLLAFLARNCCGRYLVVQEHASKRHLHVVFETTRTYLELVADSTDLSAAHPAKKRKTSARPVAHNKDAVTDGFFAYVNKEAFPVILYKHGFTDEELAELHAASEAHRAKLKNTVYEVIASQFTKEGSPGELHRQVAVLATKYYRDTDKMAPPNIRGLIRYWLTRLAGDRDDVVLYLAELNL